MKGPMFCCAAYDVVMQKYHQQDVPMYSEKKDVFTKRIKDVLTKVV